jgi:hypothetical protein
MLEVAALALEDGDRPTAMEVRKAMAATIRLRT